MLYGAILRSPVEGGAPDTIDEKAIASALATTPAITMVRVVRLPYGVGVIADTPWAAFAAKEALKVTWTRTGKAWGFNSEKALNDCAAAARGMSRPTNLWCNQRQPTGAPRPA